MIEATNELYRAHEYTIKKACVRAWMKNPVICLDDYFSYAEEIFMDATRSFEPSKGVKFNSWLTTQLLRLKPYANRGGAMTSDSRGVSDSLVLSLDQKREALEGVFKASRQYDGPLISLHDIRTPASDAYSSKISEPCRNLDWVNRLDSFRPYLGELGDDARVMVDDIIDGEVSKKDENGVPVPEKGRVWYSKLTPRQLYTRVYRRRGWSLERVILARGEVEKVLTRINPGMAKFKEAVESGTQVQEELF